MNHEWTRIHAARAFQPEICCISSMTKRHVIRVHSWFKTTAPFVFIRGSKSPPHSCPFVLIRGSKPPPHSCPFVFIRGLKPPPHSCRFVSIRGSTHPFIRVHSCPFVVQPTPFIRVHSWFKTATRFVVPNTESEGSVTPHPRPLSPSRGEGCQVGPRCDLGLKPQLH